jgi:large subunit ribosomal protein L4
MPRKMRHLALKSALAAKAQENQIKVVDEITLDGIRTRDMKTILERLDAQPSALILLPDANVNVARSAQNLENVKTLRTGYLNVRDLLGHEILVMSKAALSAVEAFFASAGNGGK